MDHSHRRQSRDRRFESKHVWVSGDDGLLFGSGWPRKLTMHFPQNSRRRSGRRLTAKAGLTVEEFRKQALVDAEARVAETGETVPPDGAVPPVGVGWRQGSPPGCAGLGWAGRRSHVWHKNTQKNIVLQYIGRGLASGISACVPMPAPWIQAGRGSC